MQSLLKSILVGAILAISGAAIAADAADPVVGKWSLNVAKSKFESGPTFKSQTRTYTHDGDGISVSVTGTLADGTAMSQQATFKYDNKAYPWSGSADYDAISLKRVNASTVTAVMMKSGKKVGNTTRTISAHGKVMTLSSKIIGAGGKPVSTTLVFDKQ